MTHTRGSLAPTPGSWPSIALIYCFGVLSSASLSKAIPMVGDVGLHLGASPAQFAWLISLFGVMPALLASMAGSIIDRIGPPLALRAVAVIGLAVNAAYFIAPSLGVLMAVRVVEGLIAVGAYSAAPALIMSTTSDARRGRAMAVWSTYTPVGISLGLVLGGAFAGTDEWRSSYLVHGALFAALLVASFALPHPNAVPPGAPRAASGLFGAWRQTGPLRLALTFAVLVLMGFGMNSVYPQWYSLQHGIDAGGASSILAVVNLAMIPAGFATGALLARGWRDSHLLTALSLATALIAWPLFAPGLGEPVRLVMMVAWMLVQGALIAVVTAALPRVVASPAQGAAAAGLLSQLAALVTFFTPFIWQPLLQGGLWSGFVVITVICAVLTWLLFPRRARL